MDYPCEHVVAIDEEPRHHLVIANQYVRAFVVEIAPHDRTLCHHHAHDYLLYVAGDAEIVSAARGEEPKRLSYCDGECELSSAGLTHVVENVGETIFRNIVVELPPLARELLRGGDPRVIAGKASVKQLLNNDRVAVLSVTFEPGDAVVVSGPAILVTPYGKHISSDTQKNMVVLEDPCDLTWVSSGEKTTLHESWTDGPIVVVFQLGRAVEEASVVSKLREPLKSLRAHADEPEEDL
jgi:hypothetical protein